MNGPVPGLTLRRTDAGIAVARLHYSADPQLTPDRVKKLRAGYPSESKWRQEMEIDYGAQLGTLIYPEYDPAIHVVPASRIPRRGCRYMAIDPHPRTPHAFLWLLIDRWSDWWIYREMWPSTIYGKDDKLTDSDEENSYTIREYAEALAYLEGNWIEWYNPETDSEYGIYRQNDSGEKIIFRLMDQAGKGFRASAESALLESYAKRYTRYGVPCKDPRKSHETGEDAIHGLLKARKHDTYGNWPRLHISEECVELDLEMRNHRYRATKKLGDEKELKQDESRARCHLVDLLRYLGTSQASFISSLES